MAPQGSRWLDKLRLNRWLMTLEGGLLHARLQRHISLQPCSIGPEARSHLPPSPPPPAWFSSDTTELYLIRE